MYPSIISIDTKIENSINNDNLDKDNKNLDFNNVLLSCFYATYRIGNGSQGNVGAETISHIVLNVDGSQIFKRIYNPLAAQGGINPEGLDLIKQYAPHAFRTQQRAVTEDDYINILKQHPGIQNSFVIIRWTGSWYTVFVSIDRFGGSQSRQKI